MAKILKEANFNGRNGSHFKIRLSYDLSQNQANNTSTIKYYLYMISMDGYSGSGATARGYINGGQVGTFTSIGVNATKQIGTKSITVTHNNDGTKSVSYSASVDTSWSLGDASLSGTLTLPTIKRQANITSAPDFTDEENPTITYTNPLGNSVTGLQACIANVEGATAYVDYRDIPKTGTSYTFELTEEERNVLRQATTTSTLRSIKFFVRTNINGTYYYSTLQRTLTIVNANPTQTVVVTETNQNVINVLGNDSTATYVVQNASELQFASTPSTLKYATVKNVSLYHNGVLKQTITTSPYTFNPIKVETNTFNVVATDSRNLQANNEFKWTANYIIEYIQINIDSFSFKRENPTSSNIKLNAQIRYKQATFGTTENVPTIKWKLGTDGTLNTLTTSDYTIDAENNKITISNLVLENVLPYTEENRFYLYVNDLLTEDAENEPVLRGIPTCDMGEHDFQVNGDLFVADVNRQNKIDASKIIRARNEAIVIGLSSDITINPTVQYQRTKLNLSSEMSKLGDKLTLIDGEVKIGKGISKVRVSANGVLSGSTQLTGIIIAKNGDATYRTFTGSSHTSFLSCSISEGILDVKENDLISLYVYTNTTTESRTVRAYDGYATYLCVEAVY